MVRFYISIDGAHVLILFNVVVIISKCLRNRKLSGLLDITFWHRWKHLSKPGTSVAMNSAENHQRSYSKQDYLGLLEGEVFMVINNNEEY